MELICGDNFRIREHGLGGVTENEMTSLLRYLGRLYDNSREGEDSMIKLQMLLSDYNVTLDYRGIMQEVTRNTP